SFPMAAGYSDKFLIKADKTPNTRGAMAIALAGPTAPGAATIVADAVEGRLDALWVFGHDLTSLVADADLQQLSRSLRLFMLSGTNENATAARSHWTLPTAAYLEKDGTFVNVHGRVQRVGCAFSPLSDSRADWNVLLEIAGRPNLGFAWRSPQEVFQALAASVAPSAGLTYERIGLQGSSLTTDASVFFALVTVAAIPVGGRFLLGGRVIELQVGKDRVALLYIFAMLSLGVYGVILAGFASRNNYALLGGLRATAQMISYEIALG